MGMYTGLRVRGKIKPELVEALQFALTKYNDPNCDENHWSVAALEFPILAALPSYLPFAIRERASYIPGLFSGVGDWDAEDPNWPTSLVDGYLVLQTVIKNYDCEIDAFLQVMPEIFETVDHCEELYCEMDVGALFTLENGEMIQKTKEISYSELGDARSWFGMSEFAEEERWQSPWMLSQTTKPSIDAGILRKCKS